METVFKEIFKAIPLYFKHFMGTLTQPAQFPYQRTLTTTDEEENNEISKALSFFTVSIVICTFFGVFNMDWQNNLYSNLAKSLFAQFLVLVLGAVTTQLSYKLLGGTAKFMKYMIAYTYHCSVYYVLIQLLVIVSQGFIMMMHPENGKMIVSAFMTGTSVAGKTENSIMLWAQVIFVVGAIASIVWLVAAYHSYRLLNQFSKVRHFFAALICCVTGVGYYFLVLMIHKGIEG